MDNKEPKEIFTFIYETNKWGNSESISGSGSTISATKYLIPELKDLIKRLKVISILDIPCGDFNWMQHCDLSGLEYHGGDIVDNLITSNRKKYSEYNFSVIDLVEDPLPKVDLIFCRDCLFHLPNSLIIEVLKNICKSGSKYLLTTTFTDNIPNKDIKIGQWRHLNLELAPFSLPSPLEIIREKTYKDKSMGLWLISDILFDNS